MCNIFHLRPLRYWNFKCACCR